MLKLRKDAEAFTPAEWGRILLRKKWQPSAECVIATNSSAKSIRIMKHQQRCHFQGWQGADLHRGREIEVKQGSGSFPRIPVPEWAGKLLMPSGDSSICVTKRDGRFFLKTLRLIERPTLVPCCFIADEFFLDKVVRKYAIGAEPRPYVRAEFETTLNALGKLRRDPLRALAGANTAVGLLTRKNILAGWSKKDRDAAASLRREMTSRQLKNGSWQDNTIQTACTVIRLLELGAKVGSRPIDKACRWLVATPEPCGFPGMFLSSPKLTKTYNDWRDKFSGVWKQFRLPKDSRPKEMFAENCDLFGRVISLNRGCHKWSLWSSAVSIEALLRCGYADDERVQKAIGTLLTMRFGGGSTIWCANGMRRSDLFFAESKGKPDFNITGDSMKSCRADWPQNERDVLKRIADHNNIQWSLGAGKSTLMRRSNNNDLGCSRIVQRALSWHPEYRGSSVEMVASLEQESMQGWDGLWPQDEVVAMLRLLERSNTSVAGAAVLRTLPSLIRYQGEDGLWDLGDFPGCGEHGGNSRQDVMIPEKDMTTYLILKTLKKFEFLETVLPDS
ncbi:hypothetical protein ACFLSJ_06900 [Verrucomicrobiota bacterium]